MTMEYSHRLKVNFSSKFCMQFRIILKSMRNQYRRQRKIPPVKFSLWSVTRTELHTKVCANRVSDQTFENKSVNEGNLINH